MIYKVTKTKQAKNEYEALTQEQKDLLDNDYKLIETEGLERVSTKKIEKICLKSEQKDCGHYTHTVKML